MESLISIVLPAYNEEGNIALAVKTLTEEFRNAGFCYELIFVNDGSKDNTWSEIEKAKSIDSDHIKGICFSRNFGKEAAVFAGLNYASGDAVVVMDCDMQHPPKTVLKMYKLWKQGYEVVEGVKISRGKESALHGFAAKSFYKIISKATGIDMANASDFKLMDRKVVDTLREMPERNSFFRALSSWVGFRTVQVGFEVQERQSGKSKWSTKSLIKYAITNITSFTTLPLQLVTMGEIFVLLLAVILGVQTLVRYFSGHAVEGFTTVILLLLFIGSVIMISLGIIGYYIAKIYDEVKKRPKYIVSEII